MSVKAYYTLIQFVGDTDRDERVNLGVILQCPEYNYAAMEIRRNVERKIHCIFPEVDAQLIRYMLLGVQEEFERFSDEPQSKPMLRSGTIHEINPTTPDYLEKFNSPFGQIFFRPSSPIFVRSGQSFTAKLKQLSEKLLDSQSGRRENKYVTKYELRTVVEYELNRRHISIIKNPPRFPGKRWPNSFDALKEKRNRRWLQFISYRQAEIPIDQTKSFIASVVDMRDSQRYPDDEWACVIKEPFEDANRSDKDTFASALNALRAESIAVFFSQDIDRLATGLESPDGLRAVV